MEREEKEMVLLKASLMKQIQEESEQKKRETIPDYDTQVGRPSNHEEVGGWTRGGINE